MRILAELHEALLEPETRNKEQRAFHLNVSLSDAEGFISLIACAKPPSRRLEATPGRTETAVKPMKRLETRQEQNN